MTKTNKINSVDTSSVMSSTESSVSSSSVKSVPKVPSNLSIIEKVKSNKIFWLILIGGVLLSLIYLRRKLKKSLETLKNKTQQKKQDENTQQKQQLPQQKQRLPQQNMRDNNEEDYKIIIDENGVPFLLNTNDVNTQETVPRPIPRQRSPLIPQNAQMKI